LQGIREKLLVDLTSFEFSVSHIHFMNEKACWLIEDDRL